MCRLLPSLGPRKKPHDSKVGTHHCPLGRLRRRPLLALSRRARPASIAQEPRAKTLTPCNNCAVQANGRQHYNVTLAVLVFAGIAFALQQTLVIPALPAFQRDLHTSTTWVTWLL